MLFLEIWTGCCNIAFANSVASWVECPPRDSRLCKDFWFNPRLGCNKDCEKKMVPIAQWSWAIHIMKHTTHCVLVSPCRHPCSNQGSRHKTCFQWSDSRSTLVSCRPSARWGSHLPASGAVSNAAALQTQIPRMKFTEKTSMNSPRTVSALLTFTLVAETCNAALKSDRKVSVKRREAHYAGGRWLCGASPI